MTAPSRAIARNDLIALSLTWALIVCLLYPLSRSADAAWLDFSSFYSAAHIVAAGDGGSLFEADAQQQSQKRLFGRSTPLFFYHPPFELLPLLPLSWLDYRNAVLVWGAAQALALMFVPALMRPLVARPRASLHLAAVCFAFPPLWIGLAQGQDSVLLLILLILCGRDLVSRREGRAGFWLALATFKPQIALPLFLLLGLTGRLKRLSGFVAGLALVFACSVMVVGWRGLLRYPEFLLAMMREQAHGTVVPAAMINLRGLVGSTGVELHAGATLAIIALLSVGVVAATIRSNVRGDDRVGPQYAAFVASSALVSYHLNPHDVAVLLIPILIAASIVAERRDSITTRAFLALLAVCVLYSPWTYLLVPGLRHLGAAALAVIPLALLPATVRGPSR